MSICYGFPTYYEGPYKKNFKKKLGSLGARSMRQYIRKKWIIPKKRHVNAKICVTNGVSLRDGSPIHYGGCFGESDPWDNFFFEEFG